MRKYFIPSDFQLNSCLGNKISLTLLILFFAGKLYAQNFQAEGSLQKVDSDGFYRIVIPQGSNPYLNEQFSNIRIYDSGEKEVPYLLEEEAPLYSNEHFNK